MRNRLGYAEQFPMAGERIICCKNNNQKGLFNGAMGNLKKIEKANSGAYKMTADIEGILHKNLMVDPYMFRQHFESDPKRADWKKKWESFDFSHVITCHKSQGSGFPDVTGIDDSDSFRENKWKWLYTLITRSESGLILLQK